MPGIFDNSGDSGGLGGILGGLGATLFPGVRNYQLQNRQFEIMQNQFDSLMKTPGMTEDKAISIITNPNGPAAGVQYGFPHQYQPPEYSDNSFRPEGRIYGPNGFSNPPMTAGPGAGGGAPAVAPQQPQPSQQPGTPPALQQAQPIMDALARNKARHAADEAAAVETAKAQPDLPILLGRTQDLIKRLDEIDKDPKLPDVVGGILGYKGRTRDLGQEQADLVHKIEDANNALQGDLFSSMRTMSNGGKPPSLGAMREMRIADLQKARTGTVGGYHTLIAQTKKQAQDEYDRAWQSRGSPDQYKPNWQTAAAKISVPPQAAAYLKANPHLRSQFDTKYGNGAALSVLGQ